MKYRINLKHIDELTGIVAGDKCYLKEIFHPGRDDVPTAHSLAYAFVNEGGRTIRHYLKQSETYYILSGAGKMHIDDVAFKVVAGNSFVVRAGQVQWIENHGKDKLEFLVIVDPPWTKEDEFVQE